MMNQVHFILTGGTIGPCEQRAILSAKVHDAPVTLWHTGDTPKIPECLDMANFWPNTFVVCKVETPDWLKPNCLCHAFDVLAYQLGIEYGGLFLQLDTISLKPAWDLLGDADVAVSREWPAGDLYASSENHLHPFQAMFLCKKKSPGIQALYDEAKKRITTQEEKWGITGPLMLSDFVNKTPGIIEAPYPTLCGWAPGYIWKFYLGHEAPSKDTRVIHLYRAAYNALYDRRYQDWAKAYPFYAGEVHRRTDLNERLLRCP